MVNSADFASVSFTTEGRPARNVTEYRSPCLRPSTQSCFSLADIAGRSIPATATKGEKSVRRPGRSSENWKQARGEMESASTVKSSSRKPYSARSFSYCPRRSAVSRNSSEARIELSAPRHCCRSARVRPRTDKLSASRCASPARIYAMYAAVDARSSSSAFSRSSRGFI